MKYNLLCELGPMFWRLEDQIVTLEDARILAALNPTTQWLQPQLPYSADTKEAIDAANEMILRTWRNT